MNKCIDCDKIIVNRYAKRCNSCAHRGGLNHFYGKKHTKLSLLKISKSSSERRYTKEQNMKKGRKGIKNANWKGDTVGYRGLHLWVERNLGNVKKCFLCLMDNPKKRYHWANISGKYKRNPSDWLRLCVPCHSRFDEGSADEGDGADE